MFPVGGLIAIWVKDVWCVQIGISLPWLLTSITNLKLKRKRDREAKAKEKRTSQETGDPPLLLEEELDARDARLEGRLQRSMEALFDRKQRDLMASVINEIKDVLAVPTPGKSPGPSQNEEPAPEGPPRVTEENLSWQKDPRYVGAKPLYESGIITENQWANIIQVCKADAGITVNINVPNDDVVTPPPRSSPT